MSGRASSHDIGVLYSALRIPHSTLFQSEQSPSGYRKPQFGQGFLQPHGRGRTSAPHRRQSDRFSAETVGAGEEGIGAALASDGGVRSMTGVHDGGIR